MEKQIEDKLSDLLRISQVEAQDVVKYLKSLPTKQELQSHVVGMLGNDSEAVVSLVNTIVNWRYPDQASQQPSSGDVKQPNAAGKAKVLKIDSSASVKQSNQKSKSGNKNISKMTGRDSCNCCAQLHDLVRNCLNCGKIICQLEGKGPCTFCDASDGQVAGKSKQTRSKFQSKKGTYMPIQTYRTVSAFTPTFGVQPGGNRKELSKQDEELMKTQFPSFQSQKQESNSLVQSRSSSDNADLIRQRMLDADKRAF
ncbi:hypothetical protein MP228_005595 [Amoeboaphelidium protococcarum]|nr:hypothetical protein MP228_005595 [Amoeboaphelidium protococcarum]